MKEAGVDEHRTTVRKNEPQGTVLSPFLFAFYMVDFNYNSGLCHLHKFSDNLANDDCISEGDEQE